jgi:hypothetical protein
MYETDRPNQVYQSDILSAATFDLSGLPRDYFIRITGTHTIAWVQTIFQVLGVRSLLSSSLKLEGFSHAILKGSEYMALVVKQPNGYLAILYELNYSELANPSLTDWAKQLNPNQLKKDKRFQLI